MISLSQIRQCECFENLVEKHDINLSHYCYFSMSKLMLKSPPNGKSGLKRIRKLNHVAITFWYSLVQAKTRERKWMQLLELFIVVTPHPHLCEVNAEGEVRCG